MCGIFAGTNKEMINELAKLNAYRGQHSYSISVFAVSAEGETHFVSTFRDMGSFNIDKVPEKCYKICHIQYPTGESRGMESVHPAENGIDKLWHNGLIKSFNCEQLRIKRNTNERWDTMLLLKELNDESYLENLSEINGSFACVFSRDGQLFMFRNQLAPLFVGAADDGYFHSVSSVKAPGMVPLTPEVWFKQEFSSPTQFQLVKKGIFKTKENPYFGLTENEWLL